jgi:phosphatidylglycerol---prolipoprotein diacylglyceryl transferase
MSQSFVFHWSLDPIAVSLGPVAIHWYGLCWAGAFMQGEVLARRILSRLGRPDIPVSDLVMYSFLGTILGARLGHCLFYAPAYYFSHPLKIFAIWEGGMASHGGAVGLILALAWATPKYAKNLPLLTLLDVVAIPAAVGSAVIRMANFLNSEIVGIPTSGSWGVVFERVDTLARVPVQLFEAIAYIGVALVLWLYQRRRDLRLEPGGMTGIYLALVFGARIILELWKVPQAAYESNVSISVGQWLSAPFVLLGLLLIWRSRSKRHLVTPSG